MTTEL